MKESNAHTNNVVGVALALIIASALLIAYFVSMRPVEEHTMTIYLLNSDKKATDYPELVYIGKNSTFNVWVGVKNDMGQKETFQVLLKILNANDYLSLKDGEPIETFTYTLAPSGTWEKNATVTMNRTGDYMIVFELWLYDEENAGYKYSNQSCVLNIKAKEA
jgi:uncharacterized membrane protein